MVATINSISVLHDKLIMKCICKQKVQFIQFQHGII